MPGSFSLNSFYDDFPRVEAAFSAALDTSLNPRGPDMLYELVQDLQLPAGSMVVDVGCGEGRHARELATRFGFHVHGIDPVQRHIEIATEQAGHGDTAGSRMRFSLGTAEQIPIESGSVDLVWCRDVLVHVPDIDQAYAECHRILRDGGYMLAYQMFGTERLEPREAAWLWTTMGVVPSNADPQRSETAIAKAGFEIATSIEIQSEWGEWAEEQSDQHSQHLLHAARLTRGKSQFVAEFGQPAYDIMLGDALWHIYRMIGKLSGRVYCLSKDVSPTWLRDAWT